MYLGWICLFLGWYLVFVCDGINYLRISSWRGMMRLFFGWKKFKTVTCLWKDRWMDGWINDHFSQLWHLHRRHHWNQWCPTSIPWRRWWGRYQTYTRLACIHVKFSHASPGARKNPEIPLDIIICKFPCWTWCVYWCTMTQVVYSLFGSPFPLHSEHRQNTWGKWRKAVVKSFAQKKQKARTYPALNRYSSKRVYPCLSQFQYEAIWFYCWDFFLPPLTF